MVWGKRSSLVLSFTGAPRAEFGETQIRLTSERPRPGRLGLLGEIQALTPQGRRQRGGST